MTWYSGLEDICRTDVPLAERVWYGLGGRARWFFTPRTDDELAVVLARCHAGGVAWRMLGHGANVLVRDAGVDGAVIHLTGPFWEHVEVHETRVAARAGADFPKLVKRTIESGLVGLENLAGIPGSLGGAIRMNAGGRHGSISQFVQTVDIMDPAGQRHTRSAAQMGFSYRRCQLDGAIVLGATLELARGDSTAALARFREIWNEKYQTQPPISARSAGCVFKNPPGQAAGKLIDQAGLKGCRRGGAEISTRHANFILAYPGATAQDVLDLALVARERVRNETGIELEFEIEVW